MSIEEIKEKICDHYCRFPYDLPEDKLEEECKMCPLNELKADESKMGRCKDCKYFEYDSLAKVDGIPLIVAHEICKKWGGGCKTREDGYCFLFEPQEDK